MGVRRRMLTAITHYIIKKMKTFDQLGLASEIVEAIQELGFDQPMPVQEEVIPLLLAQTRDIIALAQTGTGKTAAFGLPIIQKIDVTQKAPQTLILCPTRELCLQISADLIDYSKYVDGIKILPVYGGSSIDSQIRTLKRGVHVIVATPGRLIDLLNRKVMSLDLVHTVVLDEADEMLNMGFTESIDDILSRVPEGRSMLLFSATMPKEIARITKKYMEKLKQYEVVLTPDFSPYADMPLATQIFNHYRKHWVGALMQEYDVKVVPTIRASRDERSLDFYLDGEPSGGVVCISSMWTSDDEARAYFLREYETMRKTLKPEKIYVYGNEVEGLKGNIEYIQPFTRKRFDTNG